MAEIFTCAKTTRLNECASVCTRSLASRRSKLLPPLARVAALAEGDAGHEKMHKLVNQQAAEERADQAELQAESEPHRHGDQGRRAGARLGEERRAVIV